VIKILVASNNSHKINEIKNILGTKKYKIYSLLDLNIISDPIESGKTFYDNALIKALEARKYSDLIIIADDSGLIVPILNNEPGIYSKRYAGKNASDDENNKLLIENIKQFDEKERRATFVTSICLLIGEKDYEIKGVCEGKIILSEIGTNGFGYDPIFYIEEYKKTFAQLEEEEKNKISHRGNAIRKLKVILEELL